MKRIIILSLTVSMLFVPLLFSQNQPVQKQIKPYELKQAAQFDSVLVGLQVQRESKLLKAEVTQLKSEVRQLQTLTKQLVSRLEESETQGQQLEDQPDRSQYHSLVIPACAFVPEYHNTQFDFEASEENNFLGDLRSIISKDICLFAPVYLPHGATVKSVEMGFNDVQRHGDFSPNVELKLVRRRVYRDFPGWHEMAVLRSKNMENYWEVVRTDSINHPNIDNDNYGYLLKLTLKRGKGKLTLVKISYED